MTTSRFHNFFQKSRIPKVGDHSFRAYAKFPKKLIFLPPPSPLVCTEGGVLLLVRLQASAYNFTRSNTPLCVYLRVRNVIFSENFMYVLNE